jgi:hypothetical protein
LAQAGEWRRCSACKKPIALAATYYVCSVSTCNRPRTGLVFCDVSCWEVHLPVARHREAWAEEQTAPRTAAVAAGEKSARPSGSGSGRAPRRTLARPAESSKSANPSGPPSNDLPQEVLIIASRLKDYVRARSGMNTSDRVLEPLSKIVRSVCEEAIRNAERDERKTILDRDIPKPR